MADPIHKADREAISMGLLSGLITGLGSEWDRESGSWMVIAIREWGESRWMLCDEIREGEDTVLRAARFDGVAEALEEAARLVPPGA
ncbi:hypothetical protein [Thiohalorhabdus sp.]|uniref:hypothetical protein n=1 Tax=Thiohalorhabdus sp. TaxID=3094134 RepID=UPI002FC31003